MSREEEFTAAARAVHGVLRIPRPSKPHLRRVMGKWCVAHTGEAPLDWIREALWFGRDNSLWS